MNEGLCMLSWQGINMFFFVNMSRLVHPVKKTTISPSFFVAVHIRTSHGGVHWDAVHGDNSSSLQDSEGAQPELHPAAVHQRLPSGPQRCQPQCDQGKMNRASVSSQSVGQTYKL